MYNANVLLAQTVLPNDIMNPKVTLAQNRPYSYNFELTRFSWE